VILFYKSGYLKHSNIEMQRDFVKSQKISTNTWLPVISHEATGNNYFVKSASKNCRLDAYLIFRIISNLVGLFCLVCVCFFLFFSSIFIAVVFRQLNEVVLVYSLLLSPL